jgi:hypothetical protein
MQVRALHRLLRAHVEVHQPRAQVLAVDPVGDGPVVRVGHQQRQAEAAQQPLGGALPLALVLAHLDQLARERQCRLRRSTAPRTAHRGCGPGRCRCCSCAARGSRSPPISAVCCARPCERRNPARARGCQVGDAFAQAFGTLAMLRCWVRKAASSAGAASSMRPRSCWKRSALRWRCVVLLQAADLGREFLQPVAAVVTQRALQPRDFDAFGLAQRVQAFDLRIQPRGVLGQQRRRRSSSAPLSRAKYGAARRGRRASPGSRPAAPVALAVVDQRRQQLHLPLGLEHRLVRAVQVVEVADQRLDALPTSKGSSMWLRTKSVRLPTDFIDTVWWNSSSACSCSMPKRRRNHAP